MKLLCTGILLLHVALLSLFAATHRFDFNLGDEPIHFGAGSVIWHTRQVAQKMTEYHPPLSYYLNSLFLGRNPVNWDRTTNWFEEAEKAKDPLLHHRTGSIGWDLLWTAERNGQSVPWLFFRGRVLFILLSTVLAFALYRSLRPLDALSAAAVASIYALSSLTLSIVPGLMTDATFTVFASLAVLSFAFGTANPDIKRYLRSGVLMGLALASKVSGVLLLAIVAVAAFRARRWRMRGFVFSLIATSITLWALYGFQVDSIRNAERLHHSFPEHEHYGRPPPISRLAREYPMLYETRVPAVSFVMAFRWGIHRISVKQRERIDGPLAFLESGSGYPWAVLATYFPLGFLLLIPLAVGLLVKNRNQIDFRSRWSLVALWPVLYSLSSFRGAFQLGARHLFPLFPLALLVAAVPVVKFLPVRQARVVLATAAGITFVEALLYLNTNHPWSLWMYI
jgi:hypothetical protein